MYPNGDVDNLKCGQCKYFSHTECTCKRIDHEVIRFAQPWFKSYDRNQHSGIVCSDFEPQKSCVYLYKTWRGFEYFWPKYVEQWLPYKNVNMDIGFIINKDTSVRYYVNLLDYVFGNMLNDGYLKAHKKVYSKKDRDPNGFGYKLITETIPSGLVKIEAHQTAI